MPALPRGAVVHDKGVSAIGPNSNCLAIVKLVCQSLSRGTRLRLVEAPCEVDLAEIGR